jgi:hypothetical protein
MDLDLELPRCNNEDEKGIWRKILQNVNVAMRSAIYLIV